MYIRYNQKIPCAPKPRILDQSRGRERDGIKSPGNVHHTQGGRSWTLSSSQVGKTSNILNTAETRLTNTMEFLSIYKNPVVLSKGYNFLEEYYLLDLDENYN